MIKKDTNFENIVIRAIDVVDKKGEDYDTYDIQWQKVRRFSDDTKHRKGLVS
jgi:hypothetical protein